ncbi:PQQ-binding-like beta-propeller repeat protein [Actinocorallia sp. B10E7]|uniref:outer membrane protein assembly factor BamB family protein n=1 Tax=Actinocorallia sp. B10E7 TaxID=3153558 RepID=UPI00325CF367
MPSAALKRLLSASFSALMVAGCSGGTDRDTAHAAASWTDTRVNAVSRASLGSGVVAVTGLRSDGALETVVDDLATGRRLWARPATMAGRLPGMGVQPPAVAGPVVVALEPRAEGPWKAMIVARDARTGEQRWARGVRSTFGPVACGTNVCLSESTAQRSPRFVVLDGGTGRTLWRLRGLAEVEHADRDRIVVFRMAERPVLAAHATGSGRRLWTFPVEDAVGSGVDLSGGWSFGTAGELLLGHVAPARRGRSLSAYGFFALRLADGSPVWAHPRQLRVYPSPNPAVGLITREVGSSGNFEGFARIDTRTGRKLTTIPSADVPRGASWWLSFSADLSTLGFRIPGRKGAAFDLRQAAPVPLQGLRAWSFCTTSPEPLRLAGGAPGFFPVASLCAYDLATGEKTPVSAPPPVWFTGSVDGHRVWRDEQGALHGTRDTTGTTPGMYG